MARSFGVVSGPSGGRPRRRAPRPPRGGGPQGRAVAMPGAGSDRGEHLEVRVADRVPRRPPLEEPVADRRAGDDEEGEEERTGRRSSWRSPRAGRMAPGAPTTGVRHRGTTAPTVTVARGCPAALTARSTVTPGSASFGIRRRARVEEARARRAAVVGIDGCAGDPAVGDPPVERPDGRRRRRCRTAVSPAPRLRGREAADQRQERRRARRTAG